ncbi:hypothetical protein AAFN85_00705 [Mucilaginibacter sp. CAU 1740]|uniref:hypothetical protein n=1 Tax=Mucilaginibacter sp. CAU 1740 TaxID=3140365 RepID=UPI00325BBA11
MTLLATWIASDNKKEGLRHSSIYITTDSRISWEKGKVFDGGQKVFGSKSSPDIFGYVGDVTFASTVISKLKNSVDDGLIFTGDMMPMDKFDRIFNFISSNLNSYPLSKRKNFVIIHCTRAGTKFFCHRIGWSKILQFNCQSVIINNISELVIAEGSGAVAFRTLYYSKYDRPEHNDYRTSRAVFHCFTEILQKTKDYTVGGAAQVVGLYRSGNARFFGFIHENKRYYLGDEVNSEQNLNFVEWRNERFERCAPENMKLIVGAQRQPKT